MAEFSHVATGLAHEPYRGAFCGFAASDTEEERVCLSVAAEGAATGVLFGCRCPKCGAFIDERGLVHDGECVGERINRARMSSEGDTVNLQ